VKTSPTARTLAELRKQGHVAQVTERWNQWAKRRIDLFGFIDVVALRPGEILGIQSTTSDNHAARRSKIAETDGARAWLDAGGRIEIWSWRKAGRFWIYRREPISADGVPERPALDAEQLTAL